MTSLGLARERCLRICPVSFTTNCHVHTSRHLSMPPSKRKAAAGNDAIGLLIQKDSLVHIARGSCVVTVSWRVVYLCYCMQTFLVSGACVYAAGAHVSVVHVVVLFVCCSVRLDLVRLLLMCLCDSVCCDCSCVVPVCLIRQVAARVFVACCLCFFCSCVSCLCVCASRV